MTVEYLDISAICLDVVREPSRHDKSQINSVAFGRLFKDQSCKVCIQHPCKNLKMGQDLLVGLKIEEG